MLAVYPPRALLMFCTAFRIPGASPLNAITAIITLMIIIATQTTASPRSSRNVFLMRHNILTKVNHSLPNKNSRPKAGYF